MPDDTVLLSDLHCPHCGEDNTPTRPQWAQPIQVDARGEAACDACGYGAPLAVFIRKETP